MTQPIRIECASIADVATPEQLATMTGGRYHVVLQFPSLSAGERAALIRDLSTALPECTVFDSSGGLCPAWVTIKRVVESERVLRRRAEVLRAVAEYRRLCAALVDQYQARMLPREWRADEHGGHCCFTHHRTGQVVEAPIREWVNPDRVDPYFFARFVKTTAGMEPVAALIEDDFHDALRVLEVVGVEV